LFGNTEWQFTLFSPEREADLAGKRGLALRGPKCRSIVESLGKSLPSPLESDDSFEVHRHDR